MVWPRLRALVGLLVLVGWMAAPRAAAQVLDDSTKVLYGPKTTRIIYEAEILRDSTSGTPLDTTLTRWPQTRFWFHDTTFQQDLGAVGTASRPLLYRPNLQLGARFGRNVFDKYARDPTTVPYYDTRSPYSFFRVLQSGAGEQVFEFSYSRSLRKNFSVGVAYERIASNKILGLGSGSPRGGLVEHSNLLFSSRFQTDNERYHLLFNFTNVRHRGVEQGGIWPVPPVGTAPGQETPNDLFTYERERVYLNSAVNTEDRDQVYFTQTYRLLGRGLTVYHTFDAKRQYNNYSDLGLQQPGALVFYSKTPAYNVNASIDRAEFRQVENTVGVLGRTDAVEYRLYARDRSASLTSKRADSTSVIGNPNIILTEAAERRNFNQVFFGGTAAFNYRTIYAVETAGEILGYSFIGRYTAFPEYWLRASVRTGPLSGEFLNSSYSPTLTQQQFVGNHYEWNHLPGSDSDFENTNTTQLTGRLRLKLPSLGRLTQQRFEGSVSWVNIDNLVYYGTDAKPVQEADVARTLFIVKARHQVRFGRVNFDNEATYTEGGDVNGIRIPALVTNTRVFYESYIFRKALFSQVGAEMYYQSRYRAFNYNPSTQQFYQQDNFTIRNYPIVDVFFSADIKAVTVYLKVAHVNQGIMYDGYFTTPYYTGYPRRFVLGLKWDFFN
ncbi:putative porin [Hymenobacter arizonensis]|uniref:Putative porin n=1 Tax=Hymenobacter arizonensis TaxID=1227077 RepID=A0A1I5UDF1_HYMAR|nr:putative porin [Hymenobacter arizonensis]SFP93285.1 Putative porin [Hymenobacter arizonensis]